MITKLILDGALKLVQVCKYSNHKNRIAKVLDPRGTVPEHIYYEVTPNMFKDTVNNKLFKLTPEGMENIAVN